MSSNAQPDDQTTAELLEVERARQQALIDVDLATLDNLFDDSMVHVHAPGLIHSKSQLIEHTATRRAYLEITRSDLNIRVFRDTAIITGPISNRLRTKEGGERTLSGVATQVLHRAGDGRWRFVSFQMTPYGEQEWGALPSEAAPSEGAGSK